MQLREYIIRSCIEALIDMQDLLDDEAVLDAIDEENEFQALVVSFLGTYMGICVIKL